MTETQFYNNDLLSLTVNGVDYNVDVKAKGTYIYEPETR